MYNRKTEEAEEEEDFLEEMMREFSQEDPYFAEGVEAYTHKDELLEKLAARREALGMSRAEVAKRLDITADQLESIERGEANPRLALVMHLAFILGQTLELRLVPALEDKTEAGKEDSHGTSTY
jgi:DNA-binding XRE family transcriptional regulator